MLRVALVLLFTTYILCQSTSATRTKFPSASATVTNFPSAPSTPSPSATASNGPHIPIDHYAPCSAIQVAGVGTIPTITEFGSTTNTPAYNPGLCNQGNSPTTWYSFFAPYDSHVSISTCSSYTNFDTYLGVYTGSCQNLVCRFNNDNSGCANGGSTVQFTSEGVEYFVAVSGANGASGKFELTISSTAGDDPSCARATPIDGPYFIPVTIDGTTVGANRTTYDTCGLTSSSYVTWYSITPFKNKALSISTCSSFTNYDSYLAVFSGDCTNLVCQYSNDDNCTSASSLASEIVFTPTNSSYLIAVSGYSSNYGNFELTIAQNDINAQTGCLQAFPVTVGVTGSVEGSNSNGIALTGSICSSETGNAIWYRVLSTTTQTVTFTTCNDFTNFDTYLSVYSGSCNQLECVTFNDDACSENRSSVTIDMFANEEVYLVITGYSGQTGQYVIDIITY